MSGVAVADLSVGGLFDVAAYVSGNCLLHAAQAVENGLDAPEAAATKYRCLFVCHGDWMSNPISKLHPMHVANTGRRRQDDRKTKPFEMALEDCVHTWDHYGQLVENF